MKRHASCAIDNDEKKTEAAAPITTNEPLNAITKDFKQASFLAVDTEFIRERTYYPQLCLIQISDGIISAAIDPLSKNLDLTPIWGLMRDKNITKVFHAGSQDMEIFLGVI